MLNDTLKQTFTISVISSNRFLKRLLILLLLAVTQEASAQKRQILNLPNYDYQFIHLGFILGVNSFGFTNKPIEDIRTLDTLLSVTPESSSGFTLGFLSNFHMTDNFDLRILPSLSFGERTMVYKINFVSQDSIYEKRKLIESTLIELPILLKFKSARHNNFRAYMIGGFKPTIDMASQDKVDTQGEKILKLKRNDYHYEIGVGFDFYSQYFKFSPEIKLAFGMRNLAIPEGTIYTLPIQKLTSRAVYVSFTFE